MAGWIDMYEVIFECYKKKIISNQDDIFFNFAYAENIFSQSACNKCGKPVFQIKYIFKP